MPIIAIEDDYKLIENMADKTISYYEKLSNHYASRTRVMFENIVFKRYYHTLLLVKLHKLALKYYVKIVIKIKLLKILF